jgi:hypothetical protein
MNLGKPIVLSPAIGGFAIFDDKGQGVGVRETKCCGGRNFGTYLAGNVTHAHFTYDGLDPDVKSLARVSIKFFFTGSGRYTEYEFRDVPLGRLPRQRSRPRRWPRLLLWSKSRAGGSQSCAALRSWWRSSRMARAFNASSSWRT